MCCVFLLSAVLLQTSGALSSDGIPVKVCLVETKATRGKGTSKTVLEGHDVFQVARFFIDGVRRGRRRRRRSGLKEVVETGRTRHRWRPELSEALLTHPLLTNVPNVVEHGALRGTGVTENVATTSAMVLPSEAAKHLLALFTRTHSLVQHPRGTHGECRVVSFVGHQGSPAHVLLSSTPTTKKCWWRWSARFGHRPKASKGKSNESAKDQRLDEVERQRNE